jgi:uncharacterized protein
MTSTPQLILGTVAALFRYPVKSMAGETVDSLNVRWPGVEGDRRYAFVLSDGAKSAQIDFPWFTGREYPPLVTYRAAYDGGIANGRAPVTVTTPDGAAYPVESDELRAELSAKSSRSISLLRLGRGAHDGTPVSLISTATVGDVAAAAGTGDTDARRYRPNILIELVPGTHEDEWVGRALAIGDGDSPVRLWVTRPDERCMMINLDPRTGVQQPQVLKHVATARANTLGVYATVLATGRIAVGDVICAAAL